MALNGPLAGEVAGLFKVMKATAPALQQRQGIPSGGVQQQLRPSSSPSMQNDRFSQSANSLGGSGSNNGWAQLFSEIGNAQTTYRNAFGGLMGQYAPEFASIGSGQQYAQNQHSLGLEGNALSANALNQNYGLSQRELEIDNQALGLNREGNGLRLEGNQVDRGSIDAQRGFAKTGLDQDIANAMRQGYMDTVANKSDMVARGAIHSPMGELRRKDIYNETKARGDAARLGYDKTMHGLDVKGQHLDLDDRSIGIANRELDLQAQRIGLSGEQLRAKLEQGIAELGLQGRVSANQLAYQMAQGQGEQASLMRRIAGEAFNTAMRSSGFADGSAGTMLQRGYQNFG